MFLKLAPSFTLQAMFMYLKMCLGNWEFNLGLMAFNMCCPGHNNGLSLNSNMRQLHK